MHYISYCLWNLILHLELELINEGVYKKSENEFNYFWIAHNYIIKQKLKYLNFFK